MLRKLIKTLLLTTVVTIVSSPALSQGRSDPEALKMVNAAYAELIGGDVSEVAAYQAKVEEAAKLGDRLLAEIPDQFGGIRILPSRQFKAQVYLVVAACHHRTPCSQTAQNPARINRQ